VIALALGTWFRDTALDGSLLLAVPVALVAGLVSFFSPCVVPLLPGYLSYTTGLSGADLASARRGRMLLGSLLFVLGFSFVFVSFGALFGAVGDWLWRYQHQVTLVLGVFTIVVGIAFLGALPWLQRDWRVHKVPAVGLAAAPLLGVLFGLGWTPCIGPTLGSILTIAGTEGRAAHGAFLLAVYSAGLAIPFLLTALAFSRMTTAFAVVKRHYALIVAAGGLILIASWLVLIAAALAGARGA